MCAISMGMLARAILLLPALLVLQAACSDDGGEAGPVAGTATAGTGGAGTVAPVAGMAVAKVGATLADFTGCMCSACGEEHGRCAEDETGGCATATDCYLQRGCADGSDCYAGGKCTDVIDQLGPTSVSMQRATTLWNCFADCEHPSPDPSASLLQCD